MSVWIFSSKFLSHISWLANSLLESIIPSLHITIIVPGLSSFSNVSILMLFKIPVGKESDSIRDTPSSVFIYVGQAPLFNNWSFPAYKSNIPISRVAYISLSFDVIIAELIRFIAVSLLKPDENSLSSMLIAILLFFKALGPEPIPSLIASMYLPSFNLIFEIISPETMESFFLVFAIPVCKIKLSAEIYVNSQMSLFKRIAHFWSSVSIFWCKSCETIFWIFLIGQSKLVSSLHLSMYIFTVYLPESSFKIFISLTKIFSKDKSFFISKIWLE